DRGQAPDRRDLGRAVRVVVPQPDLVGRLPETDEADLELGVGRGHAACSRRSRTAGSPNSAYPSASLRWIHNVASSRSSTTSSFLIRSSLPASDTDSVANRRLKSFSARPI